MGLGKTAITLTTMQALLSIGDIERALVVVPKKVAMASWSGEIEKWDHLKGLRFTVLAGLSKAERIEALKQPADLHIVNFELLKWLMAYHGKKWPYDMMVVDEATRVKSPTALTTRMCRRVCRHVKRFVWLTGTGAPNGLQDLWAPMYLLDQGERLESSVDRFRQKYCKPCGFGLRQWCMIKDADKEIYQRIGDIVLSMKSEDYLTLPDLIEQTVTVDIPEPVRDTYKQMETEFFIELESTDAPIEAVSAGAKAMKLRQLASGFIFDEQSAWYEVHNAKLDALSEIIEGLNGQPTLIAYYFQPDLKRILKRFPKAIRLKTAQHIKDWNAGRLPLVLVHPACLGADTEVLTERHGWVPIVCVSREDRVFDGIEYVTHSGCTYSGFKDVIELFGITMTPDHKILISGKWEKAADVEDCESIRRAAAYKTVINTNRHSCLPEMRCRTQNAKAKCGETQLKWRSPLQNLCEDRSARFNRYPGLQYMEGYAFPLRKPTSKGLQALWWAWDTSLRKVERLQEFLRRYARWLFRQNDHRADRRERGLPQRELPLGYELGAASQQAEQQETYIQCPPVPPSGNLPDGRSEQNDDARPFIARNDSGTSSCRCKSIELRERAMGAEVRKRAHVFDITNCGPRNRFLIRNHDGDIFTSHNSEGHGLNLQDGGHHIIFYSLDWNLDNHMQLRKRLHRSGQKHTVIEHYIETKGTVDQLIRKRLETKRSVQDLLHEALKAR